MKQQYTVIVIAIIFILIYILSDSVNVQAQKEEQVISSQKAISVNKKDDNEIPLVREYEQLREVLVEYVDVKRKGSWPQLDFEGVLKKGDRNKHVATLRKRLTKEPQFKADLETEDEMYFGDKLEQAVFNFQKRYSLIMTGTVGPQTREILNLPVDYLIEKIIINLKRYWNFDKELTDKYIFANIPAFTLKVIDNKEIVLQSRTIVGKSTRPTPVFSTEITSLVLNPRWYIPRSIAVKDFLPRIKKDISYLEENNMKVYIKTETGYRKKDPGEIDWEHVNADKFNYYIWQDAGPGNYLGKVIFNSPNSLDIYLHDTPEKKLFKQRLRTFSSGCVRVEKALKLADYLLKGSDEVSQKEVQGILEKGHETKIPLPEAVPLHFVYFTAYVNEKGQIKFHKDIYGKEQIDQKWNY